jgi:hypothetical protein
MITTPAFVTPSAEEQAVALYQEIMRVSREAAEHAYMLVEASLASAKAQQGFFR